MSWVKRNLYFVVGCVLAVALLGAAGFYCFTELGRNSKNWDDLNAAYTELETIANQPIGAGSGSVDNVKTAREQAKEMAKRSDGMRKFFASVPSIPNTNHVDDRALAYAVRDTIKQLRFSAAQNSITLPPDFAFSFSAQRDKGVYAAHSGEQLSKQLGEIKAICDVLFSSRVISLETLQREHTADDASASQLDYLDIASVTNNNMIVTPYQVVFRCFSPELASVLAGFANQPYGMVVKTLTVEPADMPAVTGTETQPPPLLLAQRGGLPVVVDEKKLKVTLLLNLVKIMPPQGK